MEKQISDTELVNSNTSSKTGSSTECLDTYQSKVQSLKVFWACDEWSRCDSKTHVLCKHISFVETWQI